MTDIVLRQTRVIHDRERAVIAPGRYVWRGPAGDPVFAVRDSRECVVDGVDVVCQTPTEAAFLCERTKRGPGVIPSTMHQFRNVRIFGNGIADAGYYYRATIDENNEHMRADACSVYGCVIGWAFAGQQSKEHLLTHCRAESCGRAVTAQSSFQWIGGTAAVCNVGVELFRCGDPVTIQGVGFEACGRLLDSGGPSTDSQSISLIGVRFAADQLHTDGAMILLRHAGPLTILGGSYGDGAQPIPHVQLAGIGEQAVTVTGAKFGSHGAAGVPVVRCNPGVRPTITETGCTYATAASESDRTSTRRPSDPTT